MKVRIHMLDSGGTEMTLAEPEVFTSFDVVVDVPPHLWLHPNDVAAMSGDLGNDAEWRRKLDAMVAFAASKGWTDDQGRIRAHIAQGQP